MWNSTQNIFGALRSRLSRKPIEQKILIVEDDPQACFLFRQILYSIDSNLRIEWVDTAEEALEKMQSTHYRLIIADYFLEGNQNGMDLWNHCHKEKATSAFLLTSSLSPFVVRKLVSPQLQPTFLAKPFTVSSCRNLVKALI